MSGRLDHEANARVWANQGMIGGGGLLSATTRPTPAEDVIEAVTRLNRALADVAKAGWLVSLSVDEQRPSFAGEGAVVPVVRANLQKQV